MLSKGFDPASKFMLNVTHNLRAATPDQLLLLASQELQSGRRTAAEALYHRILSTDPRHAPTLVELAQLESDDGRTPAAEQHLRQALAINPKFIAAYNNLGNLLASRDQFDEAFAAYHQALACIPDPAAPPAEFFAIYNNLGLRLKDAGRFEEAIAAHRQAIALNPKSATAHSNLLGVLHYHPAIDPRQIADEHRQWNRQHALPLKPLTHTHANVRDPARRLRIGYCSPDFYSHAVAPMVLPLIQHHDRSQVEVFCYSNVARPDAYTERFREATDHWRDTVRLPDAHMAEQIRRDQIDILVDLAGHTHGNRLLVFARKPAPIQVTRQGYPNTTGMDAIDYRITDALADPPGFSDTLHVEKLIRLPATNWLYLPPDEASPITPLPNAPITFGCLNNFAKVTEPMLRLWAQILKAAHGSRLLLKAKAFNSASVRHRVHAIFAAEGITPERVQTLAYCAAPQDYLNLHHQVAIALDPFPYHGTTTTCDALWMGVPVITLAGKTHVSRVGVSLLTNIGLPELVANSPAEYVRIAVNLAADRVRLAHLRTTLRDKLRQSPLMYYAAFASHMESAYRAMWHTWCSGARS